MICFKRGLSLSHFYKGNKWTVHVACAGDCHSWLLEKVEGRPGDCDWEASAPRAQSRESSDSCNICRFATWQQQFSGGLAVQSRSQAVANARGSGWRLAAGLRHCH